MKLLDAIKSLFAHAPPPQHVTDYMDGVMRLEASTANLQRTADSIERDKPPEDDALSAFVRGARNGAAKKRPKHKRRNGAA